MIVFCRNIISIISLMLIGFSSVSAQKWVFKVHSESIRMYSSVQFKNPMWFISKYNLTNASNLSFFSNKGAIPPYKDSMFVNYKNVNNWPYLLIQDSCVSIISDMEYFVNVNPTKVKYIAAGYPLLISNKSPVKIDRSTFSRRKCPRVGIGILNKDSVLIYINTNTSLPEMQKDLIALGCSDAINFDGGGSVFLFSDGHYIYRQKKVRKYPNILSWSN